MIMKVKENIIMDKEDIQRTINRIAHQIYENNINEKNLIVTGIVKNGLTLANRIIIELNRIGCLNVQLIEIIINKKNPRNKVLMTKNLDFCEGKSVAIVDDVLNTGSTLIYAVNYFLQIPVKQIDTAVMVNRNHKKFPVKANFKGISLSTSLNDHVKVILDGKESGIYLS